MFKKYIYFFIPFLLFFFTYGMQAPAEDVINVDTLNYNKLSPTAKILIKALANAITNATNNKDAEEQFVANIKECTQIYSSVIIYARFIKELWDPNKFRSNQFVTSKMLQAAFKVIKENGSVGQERELVEALKALTNTSSQFISPSTKGKSNRRSLLIDESEIEENQEESLAKEKDKQKKTNALDNKELKTSDDKNTKEDSKKPTISQEFPFGKIIAIAGIVGTIAFLYHKRSKTQEHSTQTT